MNFELQEKRQSSHTRQAEVGMKGWLSKLPVGRKSRGRPEQTGRKSSDTAAGAVPAGPGSQWLTPCRHTGQQVSQAGT